MKLKSSYSISVLIAVFATVFLFVLPAEIKGFHLFLFFIFLVLFSYFVIRKYIQKRIEVLYRTIQNQKLDTANSFDLETSEEDVKKWLSEHSAEIEHLKDTEQFRRDFLGNVSHELKTPIFNIQGYILTLLEGALEDEEINRKYLLRTQKSVERMISIVEDLESISHLETNVEKIEFDKFDIVATCTAVLDALEDKARENAISLVFDKEYKPILVQADEQKINQVLTNLLVNSIKYGNENGLTKVRFFDMDDVVLVEVSDNGIGIEEPHLARLCERFYRVDGSRSREKGGTGLGLSIVKHIMESHQQTLNIRSTVGVGSTFSFTLKKEK
ncbi:MAG: ATP-binding protein [Flavobacteriales bacterium]|jgi:two-component system, OmpR family, phosphate regulon sensor histidine kinase PhoR|nr:ATP-binding protein [Flavobacteriales bacterium]